MIQNDSPASQPESATLALSPLALLRTNMRFRSTLSIAALAALVLSPAAAQRRPPTPEQRIERLEKQVRQVQRQVFPKGQPADTAGFSDAPAANSAHRSAA